MKRGTLALFLLFWGCRDDDGDLLVANVLEVPPDAVSADAAAPAETGTGDEEPESPLPPSCANDTGVPARALECTGLYAALGTKLIANRVKEFSPAVPLWSDGAEKKRWIYLPPGTKIDNSNASEWLFPVGTKAWKEFSREGHRIETRLWQKVRDNFWVKATYAWNATESAAPVSGGGDVPLPSGATYHIPTPDECQQCHRGRTDRLLGFEHVSLGLPGATGVTLQDLVAQGRLTVPPTRTTLSIGDDGTGAAAAPLAWLHINCGTTCHNTNSNAVAYAAGMILRLDPAKLDGRSALELETMKTTIGVPGRSTTWNGQPRIVPGNATNSLLFQLISRRSTANQMPPIATAIVDEVNDALVAAWINQMPPAPGTAVTDAAPVPDAAMVDATADAAVDATTDPDAGSGIVTPDAEVAGDADAGTGDSGSPPDAEASAD
jgi:hypothetical protein